MKCSLCDGKMDYDEKKGTHIWVCEDCPCVMFEYYEDKDLNNLTNRLKKGIQNETS